ncbi:MAG: hypothetical protein EP330_15085 [Deltaproteobacteria bacterium]|nr:MAG: hypothetical protein EP330_15085 [Deltaproteobacteria bacterium]
MRYLLLPLLFALPGCPKKATSDDDALDLGEDSVGEVVELLFDWRDGWEADTKVHVEYRENDRVLVEERTASHVRTHMARGAIFLLWGEGEVRPVTQVAPAPSHSWIGLHLHLARRPLIERVELTGEFSGAGRLEMVEQAQEEAFSKWTTQLLEGLRGRERDRREKALEQGKEWFTEEQAQAILREEHESVTGRWIGKALEIGKTQNERGSIYVPTAGGMVSASVAVLAEGTEPCPGNPRLRCTMLRRDAEADSRLLTRQMQTWIDDRSEIIGEDAPRLAHVEAQRVERIWVEADTLRPWREEDTLTTFAELEDGSEQTSRESIVREWQWQN